jgi:hypothetical protein
MTLMKLKARLGFKKSKIQFLKVNVSSSHLNLFLFLASPCRYLQSLQWHGFCARRVLS